MAGEKFATVGCGRRLGEHAIVFGFGKAAQRIPSLGPGPGPAVPHRSIAPGATREGLADLNGVGLIRPWIGPRHADAVAGRGDGGEVQLVSNGERTSPRGAEYEHHQRPLENSDKSIRRFCFHSSQCMFVVCSRPCRSAIFDVFMVGFLIIAGGRTDARRRSARKCCGAHTA
jgi:hypothetical protein